MSMLSSCRCAIGTFVVAALFALGCGDHGTAPPSPPEESRSTVSALSSPDIFVTTTSDIADFGGGEQVSDLPGPDGKVSLREAITAANNTVGPQVIGFNIPTSDAGFSGTVFTITPLTPLPVLSTGGTAIDGTTQAAFSGNTNSAGPEIVLDGSIASQQEHVNGLTIESSGNAVAALIINGWAAFGDNNRGVFIGSQGSDNTITANYIGTDPAAHHAVGNFVGIGVSGNSNKIGGAHPSARNVISGNTHSGIQFSDAVNTRVEGNFIGTDRTGTMAIPNERGIIFEQTSSPRRNLIGGSAAGARNVISGNVAMGVSLNGPNTTENVVQGNFIGTDVTGTFALGNGTDGVLIDVGAHRNTIGGRAQGAGNVISGNVRRGINFRPGAHDNFVQGNSIGTNALGTGAIANGLDGVSIRGASRNRIGGTQRGSGNLISGNAGRGISITSLDGEGANGNVIQGNRIGTGVNGTSALQNGSDGIGIFLDAVDNVIGGVESGAGNIIAFNAGVGVLISTAATVRNRIARNSIFSNAGLGIDLGLAGGDGLTPNDPGDNDAGPNNLMNFPVLTSARTTTERLTVRGTIDTPNPSAVTVEFFANPVPTPGGDPSGHGEGAVFLGRARPNAQGNFTASLPRVRPGTLISATATDAAGNTSEFSENIAAQRAAGDDD